MTEKELHQIEQYLSGNLSGATLQAFEERLNKDKVFYNTVLAQQHIQDALSNTKLWQFMDLLQEVETDFYAKKKEEQTYSLTDLLTMFGQESDYERELKRPQMVLRSRNGQQIELLSPERGIEGLPTIIFTLKQTCEVDLSLVIENSRSKNILTTTFPKNTTTLTIPTTNFNPGRYYWFLKGLNMVRGYFFIRKDLMPNIRRDK